MTIDDFACESVEWAPGAGEPEGAVGAEPRDPSGTVLLSRLGPLDAAVSFDGLRVGAAVTADCAIPKELSLGAWWTDDALSAGDPNERLATYPAKLKGGDFPSADVKLSEPVDAPAGAFLWLAFGLGKGECGAVAADEAEGTEALRWRPDGSGWGALDGQLMIAPVECSAP